MSRCKVVLSPGESRQRQCDLEAVEERDGHPVCLDHAQSKWELQWRVLPVRTDHGVRPTRMALVETETRA